MEKIRVLIADDHPLFRHGISALLNMTDDFEVVGEATTGDAVIELASLLQPEVIVMDIQMPGVNGIEATRRILTASPHIRILIVTMFEDNGSVFAAMRAGARGYVLKDAEKHDLLRAVRAVGSGEAIFSPAIATRVIGYFGQNNASPSETPGHLFPELTEREHEILVLIAQGLSNSEIAEHLVLSLKTVRNHVSNILGKLQVTDRARAIIRAREAGLR